MGELLKSIVNKILKVLPVMCIVLLSVSLVMLEVSLDPGIKWNEYTQDVWGLNAVEKNSRPCDSLYMSILNQHHDCKIISYI